MPALVRSLLGLGLVLAACTQQVELFPSQKPADGLCPQTAAADGSCGCVAMIQADGTLVPCVCKVPCEKDSDCPSSLSIGGSRCDAATGLCSGHGPTCAVRADCPLAHDPTSGTPSKWLCLSVK